MKFNIGDRVKFDVPSSTGGYKGEEEVIDNTLWTEKNPIVKVSKVGWVSTQFLKLVQSATKQT